MSKNSSLPLSSTPNSKTESEFLSNEHTQHSQQTSSSAHAFLSNNSSTTTKSNDSSKNTEVKVAKDTFEFKSNLNPNASIFEPKLFPINANLKLKPDSVSTDLRKLAHRNNYAATNLSDNTSTHLLPYTPVNMPQIIYQNSYLPFPSCNSPPLSSSYSPPQLNLNSNKQNWNNFSQQIPQQAKLDNIQYKSNSTSFYPCYKVNKIGSNGCRKYSLSPQPNSSHITNDDDTVLLTPDFGCRYSNSKSSLSQNNIEYFDLNDIETHLMPQNSHSSADVTNKTSLKANINAQKTNLLPNADIILLPPEFKLSKNDKQTIRTTTNTTKTMSSTVSSSTTRRLSLGSCASTTEFSGQVALIGGLFKSRLPLEFAKRCRIEGMHVVLCDSSLDCLRTACIELQQMDVVERNCVVGRVVDFYSVESVEALVDQICQAFDSIDIIFLNPPTNQQSQNSSNFNLNYLESLSKLSYLMCRNVLRSFESLIFEQIRKRSSKKVRDEDANSVVRVVCVATIMARLKEGEMREARDGKIGGGKDFSSVQAGFMNNGLIDLLSELRLDIEHAGSLYDQNFKLHLLVPPETSTIAYHHQSEHERNYQRRVASSSSNFNFNRTNIVPEVDLDLDLNLNFNMNALNKCLINLNIAEQEESLKKYLKDRSTHFDQKVYDEYQLNFIESDDFRCSDLTFIGDDLVKQLHSIDEVQLADKIFDYFGDEDPFFIKICEKLKTWTTQTYNGTLLSGRNFDLVYSLVSIRLKVKGQQGSRRTCSKKTRLDDSDQQKQSHCSNKYPCSECREKRRNRRGGSQQDIVRLERIFRQKLNLKHGENLRQGFIEADLFRTLTEYISLPLCLDVALMIIEYLDVASNLSPLVYHVEGSQMPSKLAYNYPGVSAHSQGNNGHLPTQHIPHINQPLQQPKFNFNKPILNNPKPISRNFIPLITNYDPIIPFQNGTYTPFNNMQHSNFRQIRNQCSKNNRFKNSSYRLKQNSRLRIPSPNTFLNKKEKFIPPYLHSNNNSTKRNVKPYLNNGNHRFNKKILNGPQQFEFL